MITVFAPTDWRALQREVARILTEAGMHAEVERTLQTARGAVEIDVYAEEEVLGRRSILLVECKNWQSRVPQQTIHGFRTVVAEAGANVGYIVSSAGFQSGAFVAAQLTNLRLLTWDEFQREFEEQWIAKHLLPTMAERLDALLSYTEPLVPMSFMEVDEAGVARLRALREQHTPFGGLVMAFTPYVRMFGSDRAIPSLPLRESLETERREGIPDAVLDARGYRELLEAAVEHGERVIADFRAALRDGGAPGY
jgi:hypothetical protein